MEGLLKRISAANEDEVEVLLKAVLARYGQLYPDWEISTISVRRDRDRAKQLDNTIRMLEQMKQKVQQE